MIVDEIEHAFRNIGLMQKHNEDIPYPYDKAFFCFACQFIDGLPATNKLKKNYPKAENIWFERGLSNNCILRCKITKSPLHFCRRTGTAGWTIHS